MLSFCLLIRSARLPSAGPVRRVGLLFARLFIVSDGSFKAAIAGIGMIGSTGATAVGVPAGCETRGAGGSLACEAIRSSNSADWPTSADCVAARDCCSESHSKKRATLKNASRECGQLLALDVCVKSQELTPYPYPVSDARTSLGVPRQIVSRKSRWTGTGRPCLSQNRTFRMVFSNDFH